MLGGKSSIFYLFATATTLYATPLTTGSALPNLPIPGQFRPIPKADVDGFNHIFSLFIDPINGILKQQIVKSGLDPLTLNVPSNISHSQSMGLCTGSVDVSYTIRDLVGLASARLGQISVVAGDKSSDGSILLDMNGSLLPMNLHATVHGSAFTKCGIVKTTVPFNGTVMIQGIAMDLIVEAAAYINKKDGKWKSNATITQINSDFSHVAVKLNGLSMVLNPFINFIGISVQKLFKEKIKGIVEVQVKAHLDALLQTNLKSFM